MKKKVLSKNSLLTLVTLASVVSAGCSDMHFTEVPAKAINDGLALPDEGKLISSSDVVGPSNKAVDFLLVLDDSNSMLPELTKLSQKLASFVSSLEASNISWQMCLTTTRGISSGGTVSYGHTYNWNNHNPTGGSPAVLTAGTPNLNSIFTNTIQNLLIGGGVSGDERGTKALIDHVRKASSNNCYRANAALSVILVSDEDVRSIGGDTSKIKPGDATASYQPLEDDDMPDTVISEVQRLRGSDIPFTFSSIIVKPGDITCEAEQDVDASPSHPGYLYQELSLKTDSGVGSICDADYSNSLKAFKDKIVNSLSQMILVCTPIDKKINVSINGSITKNFKLDKNILKFSSSIPEGTRIDLSYRCKE